MKKDKYLLGTHDMHFKRNKTVLDTYPVLDK
jgi:hypothetical protein